MPLTLSARYVKQPRKVHYCEWCERPITGPHIYLYGRAYERERPWPMRLHLTGNCCPGDSDPKIAVALAAAIKDLEEDPVRSNDAEDRYRLQFG